MIETNPDVARIRLAPRPAWIAAALLIAVVAWPWIDDRYVSPGQTLVLAALVVALVTGRVWARAALLGYAGWSALDAAQAWVDTHPAVHRGVVASVDAARAHDHAWFGLATLGYLGAVALLAPWRRRVFERHVWAIALIAFAASGAWYLASGNVAGAGLVTVLGLLATVGLVMRVRWGAVLGIAAGVGLAGVLTEMLRVVDLLGDHGRWSLTTCIAPVACTALSVANVIVFYLAAIAAVVGGLIAWHGSRPAATVPAGRRYWLAMLGAALTCLAALSWGTRGDLTALEHDGGLPVVGAGLCAAIAAVMATIDARATWPAAFALAASIPVFDAFSSTFVSYRDGWFDVIGVPGVLVALAGAATAVSALLVLVRHPPPLPGVPVARAR